MIFNHAPDRSPASYTLVIRFATIPSNPRSVATRNISAPRPTRIGDNRYAPGKIPFKLSNRSRLSPNATPRKSSPSNQSTSNNTYCTGTSRAIRSTAPAFVTCIRLAKTGNDGFPSPSTAIISPSNITDRAPIASPNPANSGYRNVASIPFRDKILTPPLVFPSKNVSARIPSHLNSNPHSLAFPGTCPTSNAIIGSTQVGIRYPRRPRLPPALRPATRRTPTSVTGRTM